MKYFVIIPAPKSKRCKYRKLIITSKDQNGSHTNSLPLKVWNESEDDPQQRIDFDMPLGTSWIYSAEARKSNDVAVIFSVTLVESSVPDYTKNVEQRGLVPEIEIYPGI